MEVRCLLNGGLVVRHGEDVCQLLEETVFTVSLNSLLPSDSPRLGGESPDHAELLVACEENLPPILVHRSTMRVIDGMHRLRAAALRGERFIRVRYFNGSAADSFVLAVQNNVQHGLPLSLADRTAAAERIVTSHPQWSNRAIAAVAGLSPKTVAAIRGRSTNDSTQLNARLGRDGRLRPLDASSGRKEAGRLIAEDPGMSLREVARLSGISLGTAHDVRERLKFGQGAVLEGRRARSAQPCTTANGQDGAESGVDAVAAGYSRSAEPVLRILRKDPSLRFTETGRALLRLFDVHSQVSGSRDELISGIPSHCADLIVDLAADYAKAWQDFAEQLRTRKQRTA